MPTLLIEIGAEEIPAGYIQPALSALKEKLLKKLTANRVQYDTCTTLGSPRRLAIRVENVATKQEGITEDVQGPPEHVAFDKDGNPTLAAEKFAEKVGISVNRLHVKETDKGRYVSATKSERGIATTTLLKAIIPEVVLSLPFPKTMKWSDLHLTFARPIQSILALLGDSVVSFKLGNLQSGRQTQGHFFMQRKKIKLETANEYESRLEEAHVIVDPAKRREAVKNEVERVVKKIGGHILPDDELLDIVTNLVEKPFAIVGKFDDVFLELPDEVLITAMREHQKYFAIVDENRKLMPCFVAVNNTKAHDMDVVAAGHERVIRARLADAKFFYESDLKILPDEMVERLKGVLFQADLGSMHDKALRNQEIAAFLAEKVTRERGLVRSEKKKFKDQCMRAALLAKSDLVSQMVGEFAKLQGVMGRVYADKAGEPGEIPQAIEDHYRPVYSGAPLPRTITGALVSISDKIDAICGCFAVGLSPTGGADPYALRRQGIGIIQIMLSEKLSFSLKNLIEKALSNFSAADGKESLKDDIYHFLQRRIERRLIDEGFSKDVVSAVTTVDVDHIPHVWKRADALQKMKTASDFDALASAFKRVVNIIKKTKSAVSSQIKTANFEDESENELYNEYRKVAEQVEQYLENGRFSEALKTIATLRPHVDRFFDAVMVMADDDAIRNNRLALLGMISNLFNKIADFSKITT